jgi:hypothetical protein
VRYDDPGLVHSEQQMIRPERYARTKICEDVQRMSREPETRRHRFRPRHTHLVRLPVQLYLRRLFRRATAETLLMLVLLSAATHP